MGFYRYEVKFETDHSWLAIQWEADDPTKTWRQSYRERYTNELSAREALLRMCEGLILDQHAILAVPT